MKTEKLSTESTTSSGETKVFRIFKRKKAEKTSKNPSVRKLEIIVHVL